MKVFLIIFGVFSVWLSLFSDVGFLLGVPGWLAALLLLVAIDRGWGQKTLWIGFSLAMGGELLQLVPPHSFMVANARLIPGGMVLLYAIAGAVCLRLPRKSTASQEQTNSPSLNKGQIVAVIFLVFVGWLWGLGILNGMTTYKMMSERANSSSAK